MRNATWRGILAGRKAAFAIIIAASVFAWFTASLVAISAASAQSAGAPPNVSSKLAALGALPAQQQADQVVDVLLVLAVDVSYSIDLDELALQREGYAQALISDEFQRALKEGANGRIAIAYFEWAAFNDQRIIVPWRVIDGIESAKAVADEIRQASLRRAARTSISGAIHFGRGLLREANIKGLRRVIDVSGDGPNNNGEGVTRARDAAVADGITINGLPVMIKKQNFGFDIDSLDDYYEDCVIGGAGAFVVPINSREKFTQAIRTKLILEVAGREPLPRLRLASASAPRVSCTIGEDMWRQRMERYGP